MFDVLASVGYMRSEWREAHDQKKSGILILAKRGVESNARRNDGAIWKIFHP